MYRERHGDQLVLVLVCYSYAQPRNQGEEMTWAKCPSPITTTHDPAIRIDTAAATGDPHRAERAGPRVLQQRVRKTYVNISLRLSLYRNPFCVRLILTVYHRRCMKLEVGPQPSSAYYQPSSSSS